MREIKLTYLVLIALLLAACNGAIKTAETQDGLPIVFPDYSGVTIPSTIAPLNFKLNHEVEECAAEIKGEKGETIRVSGHQNIIIPPEKWQQLLNENKAGKIEITVFEKENGKWIGYAPFPVYVSDSPIDYGLAYRQIAPGYEVYSKMGIYQRNLSNFDQEAIIENTMIPRTCVNCHSFRLTNPDDFTFHIRGSKGGTILHTNGQTKLLNTKTPKTISNFVYPFWHPSGKYIAYSVNQTKQVFHELKGERVEVVDAASDVIVYDIDKDEVLFCDKLMQDSVFETFPSFSPDGKWLYFCASSAKKMPAEYQDVKYNLCRIAFHPEDGTFGDKVDTLFNAAARGKSVTFPRPSPDGKYIMFTLIDYGNFSIWHKEADLYLLNTETGETKALANANSNDTESYHSWSSNSQWFVFSSRRLDGLYTRPFIAKIDENGNCTKPFLLPQENPDYYDDLLYSFNIPEFISKPVDLNAMDIEDLAQTSGTNVTQRE